MRLHYFSKIMWQQFLEMKSSAIKSIAFDTLLERFASLYFIIILINHFKLYLYKI